LRLVALAKANGMAVKMLYFFVDTPEVSLQRVARRVAETDLRRCFARSLGNFTTYAKQCDFWRVYDANGRQPVTLAEGIKEEVMHDSGANAPTDLFKVLQRDL
jgi:predicted ABC-type ATPase